MVEIESDDDGLPIDVQEEEDVYVGPPRLIAIIGDEDTCVGFVLAGIGQQNEFESPNYFVVDPKTEEHQVEMAFLEYVARPDIGLILITREAVEKINPLVKNYKKVDPAVMIIPGHNGPYEVDLPLAVRDIEEKRAAASTGRQSRRGSGTPRGTSQTSLKTTQSHTALSRQSSRHSLKSSKSLGLDW